MNQDDHQNPSDDNPSSDPINDTPEENPNILLSTSEEENQIILSIIASISRAMDFKHRILDFSNMQISDKILNIVQLSVQDYVKIDHLNLIWELNVGNNALSTIPGCLSIFSRVERLLLNDNQIVEIPQEASWKMLYNCRLISLANNLITGLPAMGNPFPVNLLSRLILSNNQLSFLPSYIGECVNLVELDVSGNRLITLPREIQNCTRLMRLFLQNNPIFCLPFELQHLTKLRTFRMDNITINERLYRNMYSRHETTLLELAKRFIVNSDHLLCGGQCCKMNLPPVSRQSESMVDEMDDDMILSLEVQSSTANRQSNSDISFTPTNYKEHIKGMNFELLKSQYKSSIPRHIHEELIDHTKLRPCSHCNTLMSPKSGVHFIALFKLPKKSSNQIENIPHFCRACCEECFVEIPNKLI